ncbi:TPA: ATP-binding protein [Legionella pneumophila]|nr:ATP-binding protein [Legionella pneumophila]
MFQNDIHNPQFVQSVEDYIKHNDSETKLVEFKEVLDLDKKEHNLLRPVCAFANSNSGHLIYGVKESEEGLELVGITIDDIDGIKLKIHNAIRDCIEPNINEIDIATHKLKNNKYLLVLLVKKSWHSPHRIRKTGQFHGRNSAGTYSMDIPEIRHAFIQSAEFIEKIRKFVAQRIIDIKNNNTIVPLEDGALTVMHVIPISSFMQGSECDVGHLEKLSSVCPDCRFGSVDYRYVLEGYLEAYHSQGYNLFFRSGIIESVNVYSPKKIGDYFPSLHSEKLLINSLERFIQCLIRVQVAAPFVVFLTYLGLDGYSFAISNQRTLPFDRNVINLGSHVIESLDVKAEKILHPLFNVVWNACGMKGSEHYDENGCFSHF